MSILARKSSVILWKIWTRLKRVRGLPAPLSIDDRLFVWHNVNRRAAVSMQTMEGFNSANNNNLHSISVGFMQPCHAYRPRYVNETSALSKRVVSSQASRLRHVIVEHATATHVAPPQSSCGRCSSAYSSCTLSRVARRAERITMAARTRRPDREGAYHQG